MEENAPLTASLAKVLSDVSLSFATLQNPISQIADMMVYSSIGRIPAVDPATSRLVGILSRQDMFKVRHVHRASEWKRC